MALICVAGCAPEPPALLRIGTNVWTGYEPLYLARDLGYFGQAPIRLVEYSSATQVIDAFRNRAVDAAALTLDELLLLRSHGIDANAVLVMDISEGADVVLARPPISQLADLKGRRIGVETTAVGAYMLTRALERAGLALSDVSVVPVEIDSHERAYHDQKVDAVVTFEPVRSRLLADGAVRLFDSSEIPGEVIDVLALHPSYPSTAPVAQTLDAWFRALDYLQAEPKAAAERMSLRLQLVPADTLASFAFLRLPDRAENRRLMGGPSPPLQATALKLADVMLRQGLIAPVEEARSFFDPRFLNGE